MPAALLSFPSSADAPNIDVLEDARCGITSSVAPFADERGDVFFAGDWYIGTSASTRSVSAPGRPPTRPCLLRVSAATSGADPDFEGGGETGALLYCYRGEAQWRGTPRAAGGQQAATETSSSSAGCADRRY